MSTFHDAYGILTLNTMRNLVNKHSSVDENPFLEWGLAVIFLEINPLSLTQKMVEVSMGLAARE